MKRTGILSLIGLSVGSIFLIFWIYFQNIFFLPVAVILFLSVPFIWINSIGTKDQKGITYNVSVDDAARLDFIKYRGIEEKFNEDLKKDWMIYRKVMKAILNEAKEEEFQSDSGLFECMLLQKEINSIARITARFNKESEEWPGIEQTFRDALNVAIASLEEYRSRSDSNDVSKAKLHLRMLRQQ